MDILRWADAHHDRTGEWPDITSGELFDAPNEKWVNRQQGDFSRDGFVDATDLNSLALNWQRTLPVASLVPEPSTSALAIFALAAVTCLRRRTRGTRVAPLDWGAAMGLS